MSRHASSQIPRSTLEAAVQNGKKSTLLLCISYIGAVLMFGLMAFFAFSGHIETTLSSPLQTGPAIVLLVAILVATVLVLFVFPSLSAPERLAHSGVSADEAVHKLTYSLMLRGAAVEAVCIIGFVLTFLNQQIHYVLLGGAYALIMLLFLLVRRSSEFDKILEHFKE